MENGRCRQVDVNVKLVLKLISTNKHAMVIESRNLKKKELKLEILFIVIVCPPGKYKSGVGNEPCQSCPEHSKAPQIGFKECRCDDGYYRAANDPKSMACTSKIKLKLHI